MNDLTFIILWGGTILLIIGILAGPTLWKDYKERKAKGKS